MASADLSPASIISLTLHELDCQCTEDVRSCHAGPSAWNTLPVCIKNSVLSQSNFRH